MDMYRFRSVIVLGLLLASTSACTESEDSSVEGMYEIASHTRNDSSCDGDGSAVEGEPGYLELVEGEVFGVPVLMWHDCDSEESCGDGRLDRSFVYEEGEWLAEVSYANPGADGSTCDLEVISGSLERTSDGLRIEFRTQTGVVDAPCEVDTAELHAGELPCTSVEVFVATAL